MRANTFAGQVIAVLSRRASAFELDSTELQTFPDRLWALLSRRGRIDTVSRTPIGVDQVTTIEQSRTEASETAQPPIGRHTGPPRQQAPETRKILYSGQIDMPAGAVSRQQISEARESFDLRTIRLLADKLKLDSPPVRLRVRSHPTFAELERSLDRNRRDLALARDHDRALARARALDLALARDLARARALDLARARDLASDLASVRDLVRDLDSDLVLALARARVFGFLDLVFDLVLALALARDLAISAGLAYRGDVLTTLDGVLTDLDGAFDDFTTADLRDVDLTGVRLEGVRWSSATQWPPDWVDRVALDSVEVAPGVFEVRSGNRYAPTLV